MEDLLLESKLEEALTLDDDLIERLKHVQSIVVNVSSLSLDIDSKKASQFSYSVSIAMNHPLKFAENAKNQTSIKPDHVVSNQGFNVSLSTCESFKVNFSNVDDIATFRSTIITFTVTAKPISKMKTKHDSSWIATSTFVASNVLLEKSSFTGSLPLWTITKEAKSLTRSHLSGSLFCTIKFIDDRFITNSPTLPLPKSQPIYLSLTIPEIHSITFPPESQEVFYMISMKYRINNQTITTPSILYDNDPIQRTQIAYTYTALLTNDSFEIYANQPLYIEIWYSKSNESKTHLLGVVKLAMMAVFQQVLQNCNELLVLPLVEYNIEDIMTSTKNGWVSISGKVGTLEQCNKPSNANVHSSS